MVCFSASNLYELRIYRIIFLNLLICFLINLKTYSQIPLELNDYKSISNGNYQNINIWEVWNGNSWIPASVKPDRNNNIFIGQGNEIRLTQNEEAKHVYLYSAATPGRKLNLQSFELHVYGALRCFEVIGGVFEINNVTNASTDWIYPETGKIVFKGSSRTVVDRNSWSATNSNSRFVVVFNPEDGENLIVNSAFKASKFIIQTGAVTQTVNTAGIAACSTFSFNIQAAFNGSGPYGDLIIEPGATLISECSAPLDPIIRRSVSIPAALLNVKSGGNLLLSGNNPLADAANFQFDGNVYYRGTSGNQRMIQSTMATSGNPKTYHNLFFQNAAGKVLNDSVFLTGDLTFINGGLIQDGPTFLRFQGNFDQQVINWEMNLNQIEVNKQGGTIFSNGDLRIKTNFMMKSGRINFGGKRLFINTTGTGNYSRTGGSWLNLSQLNFNQLPTLLTPTSATFPFEDVFQGGIRKIQLLGNSPRGNLLIKFTEIPGANWDPMYDDYDGTPILYQLNSYYEFSGLSPSSSEVELRISAENLIVDDVDDLRIVSNGQAAAGTHLPGLNPSELWARRNLEFGALNNTSFTVGSYRVLSILPVTWLETKAIKTGKDIKILWSTAKEFQNEKFIIHRSFSNAKAFIVVGEIPSQGDSDLVQEYEYNLQEEAGFQQIYFQLEQIDQDGGKSFSKVFRLERGLGETQDGEVRIWPNPYSSGDFNVQLPEFFNPNNTTIQIVDIQGIPFYDDKFDAGSLKQFVSTLKNGIYIINFTDHQSHQSLRLIKR